MNWPSARSSRASPPFSTTKREPDSFAAVSKSIMPRASPISKCCFARREVLRVADAVALHVAVSRRRRPGTSSFGRFGMAARASSSAFSASRSSCSSCGRLSFRRATSAISSCARASSFVALAWPISFESALRRLEGGLQGGDRGLAAVVEGDQRARTAAPAPLAQALVEPAGIVADGTDVMHGNRTVLADAVLSAWTPTASPRGCQGWRSAERASAYSGCRARGLGFRALLLDHADGDDGCLVKKQRGHRKGELADHVRRGQNRGQDEHDHDRIAALGLEELRIDDARPAPAGSAPRGAGSRCRRRRSAS